MKSAFVLGLALAANAQMDNEFASFTGADLVRHHADIRPNPHHFAPVYVVRKDDIVDDEFFGLSGADLVKYAKQSQQTVYRPTAHVVRDDELFGTGHVVRQKYNTDTLNPLRKNPEAEGTTTKKSSNVVEDVHTHHTDLPYTGNNINWKKIGKSDTVTNHLDDEELFGTGHVVRPKYNFADEELFGRGHVVNAYDPLNPLRTNPPSESESRASATTTKKSDVIEDSHTHHTDLPYTGNNINWKKIGKSDTVTNHLDDEFFGLSGADLVKYAKQSQQTVYRPTAHVVRDDEFFGRGRVVNAYDPLNPLRTNPPSESESRATATKKPEIFDDGHTHHTDLPYTGNNINWKKIGKSDTVTNHLDDELVYLEQLLNEIKTQKPEIRRKFRPVQMN